MLTSHAFFQKSSETPRENEIKFSEQNYQTNLAAGYYEYFQKRNRIEVYNLHANQERHGFGTAVFRCLMQMLFSKPELTSLTLLATRSSHLFYLYMGMIPVEQSISYLAFHHGIYAECIAKKFFVYENFNIFEKAHFGNIIEKEFDVEINHLSDAERKDYCEKLKERNKKTYSFISDHYIPALINQLQQNPNEPFTYTDTEMEMSQDGISTWRDAIERNIEFPLFKKLNQLNSYLTQEQKKFFQTLENPSTKLRKNL